MSRKTSAVWRHFLILDGGRSARCNHCGRTVVIANGSTGNLFRHIKLKHPSLSVEKFVRGKSNYFTPNKIKFTVPKKETKTKEENFASTVVEVLHSDSTNPTKFSDISENTSHQPVSLYIIESYDEYKQQELNKQLLRFIVKNLIPFNIVESQEFIKFVNMLNPNYVLPSRKTLANDILVSMHESTVNKLKCALKDVAIVALTTDRWTSINSEHLIAFTVHYLNENLELKSNFLQSFSSLQKLTSADVTLFIEEVSSNWNLNNKILAVITDGSEEMTEAVNNCNLNHLPCFVHILNQIVETGLAKINSFILKVRNVVQYFKRNSMALSKFHLIQSKMGLSDSVLVKDIPSRWDTTFNMFTSFFKNKVPLLSTIEQMQLNSFNLSLADFHYLESALKILTIFNSIKITMCSEKYFSLSKIPHMVDFMFKQLQTVLENPKLHLDIVEMGNASKSGLEQFEQLQRSELVCQGVLLDPRFKKRGFPNNLLTVNLLEKACIELHHNVVIVREEIVKVKNELPSTTEPEQYRKESGLEYFMDMWSEFESKDPLPVQDHTAAASVEVDAFLNDLYSPVESDPLCYWANISNQNKFPALFDLAKRVLCIPATSVPCEQIYSNDGHIFLKRRKYLPSMKIDKILFLYHNV